MKCVQHLRNWCVCDAQRNLALTLLQIPPHCRLSLSNFKPKHRDTHPPHSLP